MLSALSLFSARPRRPVSFPRPAGAAGTAPWRRLLSLCGAVGLGGAAVARAAAPPDVLVYHQDDARTGLNAAETQLTPASVNAAGFGRLAVLPVDGQVYAQPLFVSGLKQPDRSRRNVVFVVTEHDGVYAFDAEDGTTLWQRSFLDPAHGVTTVPFQDAFDCDQITPEIGITATPVIDRQRQTLYVAAMTKETPPGGGTAVYHQQLHALDLVTGAERPGSPAEVQATVPGTGDGGTEVAFVPLNYKARPGLVLSRNVVYTFWSSHCDIGSYHGWIIGYDADRLQSVAVFNDTPNGREGSYWASGVAPALDADGNLYVVAGNGSFDVPTTAGVVPTNLGEAFAKFSTRGATRLRPTDFFTPYNYDALNQQDQDIGSSGVLLYDAPNPAATARPHLLVSAGKEGRLYVLNRDQLGGFQAGSDAQIVQSRPRGTGGLAGPLFGLPAAFAGTLYFSAVNDAPKAFRLNPDGTLPDAPTSQAADHYQYPGSVPSVSADGAGQGIVWTIENGGGNGGILHAYDATDLSRELYRGDGPAGSPGGYVKFSVPTIAQGRVYVGTAQQLAVYGLRAPAVAADVTAQVRVEPRAVVTAADGVNRSQRVRLTNVGATPLPGPVSLVLDKLRGSPAVPNANGTTTVTSPRASFYLDAPLDAAGGGALAPGAGVTVKAKFARLGGAPLYRARVLAGPGSR